MPLAHLNIGSNQGDRKSFINQAVALISIKAGRVTARSEWIESQPWGYRSTATYLNIGLNIETEQTPQQLLATLKDIERQLSPHGRHRNSDGSYCDRDIDIDIIDYEGIQMTTDRLTIPHPHMTERPFVIEPYLQLWPHKHPIPHD